MKWVKPWIVFTLVVTFSTLLSAQSARQPLAPANKVSAPSSNLSGVYVQASAVGIQWFDSQGNRLNDLPMTPWAEAKFKANRPTHGPNEVPSAESSDPIASCLPPGVPSIYMMTFPMEIIQIPDRVIMVFEYDHFIRQIFVDGRGHQDLTPTWMGDSIGKWEGDTLVVDVNGFNDKTWIDNQGHPHSDAMHIVERIRRLDPQTIEDVLTLDDPKAYTKALMTTRKLTLKPNWNIVEYICEDNDAFSEYQKKTGTKKN